MNTLPLLSVITIKYSLHYKFCFRFAENKVTVVNSVMTKKMSFTHFLATFTFAENVPGYTIKHVGLDLATVPSVNETERKSWNLSNLLTVRA